MPRDYGKELLEELNTHDPDEGGHQLLVFGGVGSGKTSYLQLRAFRALARGDLCFWRARGIDSWHVFHKAGRCKVFLPDDGVYRWSLVPRPRPGESVDPTKGHPVELEDLGVQVERFHMPEDLFERADPDRVNVIVTQYEPLDETLWWMAFLYFLAHRENNRWTLLSIDEIDDILPSHSHGDQWYAQDWFRSNFKDFRKKFVDLEGAVHQEKDLDEREVTKWRWKVYLRGTKRPKHTRVYQRRLDRIYKGQAIIEAEFFGAISRIDPIPDGIRPKDLIQVQLLARKRSTAAKAIARMAAPDVARELDRRGEFSRPREGGP